MSPEVGGTFHSVELTRYWITFDYPADSVGRQLGFGVTALDLDDAMTLLRSEWFEANGLVVPPLREVVENIDVSTLDDHVRPNMAPPNWRGLWFPQTKPLG